MSSGFNLGQSGNATEVGAGVVKLATQAQVNAGQADDGGIPLVVTPDKIPAPNRATGLEAGEDIAAGDAVALAGADEFQTVYVYNKTSTVSQYLLDEGRPRAQEFFISSAGEQPDTIRAYTTGSQTPSFRLSVRLTLNGADLASVTGAGNNQVYTLDVSAVTFLPSTTYYIVFEDIGGAADGNWNGVSNVDQGGAWYYDGANWVEQNIDHWAQVSYQEQTVWKNTIFKADATVLLRKNINLVGFAVEAALEGNPVTIDNSPILSGAGFTPGAEYYLSDTPGQISTTPGTITREVGVALSATQILRRRGSVSPVYQPGNSFTSPCHLMYSMNAGNTGTINGASYGAYGGPMLRPGDVFSNAGGPRVRIFDTASIL